MIKRTALFVLTIALAVLNANGQKKLKAYMVADAHFDTQWNWDVQTSIREYVPKTMKQNLYLLRTYPDYIFNFEGAIKYWWMKEYYPEEYEKVKKYIANGRWHLTGSSWDACETIVCSPESWLRNILLGQTYYRQEFGKECNDVFLPDCFGFPYTMPTLMNHCGLIGFSSQKLQWRNNAFYDGGRKYPFTIGLWKGIDGSEVMMTHGFNYTGKFNDEDISSNTELQEQAAMSPLNTVYRYYGTGDRGGSPNIQSVRALEKGIKGNGPVQIISTTSDQLYKDLQPWSSHKDLPKVEGEMTMDVHGTGCYTSEAAMKLYNRQNEHLGDAAERASVAAECLCAFQYPKNEMIDNWRRIIWHQFHDDLTGTSIPRAYEFSWNDELLSLSRFSQVLTNAVSSVAGKMNTEVSGLPIVLYNNEGFAVNGVADITLANMTGNYTVADQKGKTVASQVVTDSKGKTHLLVNAHVPSTGFAVYNVKAKGKAESTKKNKAKTVENSVYKVTVNDEGNISSIIDKRNNKELVQQGKAMGLVVFEDRKSVV